MAMARGRRSGLNEFPPLPTKEEVLAAARDVGLSTVDDLLATGMPALPHILRLFEAQTPTQALEALLRAL